MTTTLPRFKNTSLARYEQSIINGLESYFLTKTSFSFPKVQSYLNLLAVISKVYLLQILILASRTQYSPSFFINNSFASGGSLFSASQLTPCIVLPSPRATGKDAVKKVREPRGYSSGGVVWRNQRILFCHPFRDN